MAAQNSCTCCGGVYSQSSTGQRRLCNVPIHTSVTYPHPVTPFPYCGCVGIVEINELCCRTAVHDRWLTPTVQQTQIILPSPLLVPTSTCYTSHFNGRQTQAPVAVIIARLISQAPPGHRSRVWRGRL